uniref:Si:ch211-132g1.3 n=1 Tax=Sinocyclocheilus grahami TaxID=75366 RepID=A0A672RQ40_SINGR
KAVNSETTFTQVTGSVAPSTTSIIWKHRDNAGTVVKVIEWDLEDGSTDIPNAKFKSHATLDKNTGNLHLKYLQLEHSGTYTVEINSKEQRKQFTLTVMEPVCKPHIVKKCLLEDVSGCLLSCVGEASSESTVIWKYWDGEKLHEQYPNMRTITVTNSGNPDSHYTCTLKNAVSVETSDPLTNSEYGLPYLAITSLTFYSFFPFIFICPDSNTAIIIAVIITLIILIAMVTVILFLKIHQIIGKTIIQSFQIFETCFFYLCLLFAQNTIF